MQQREREGGEASVKETHFRAGQKGTESVLKSRQ